MSLTREEVESEYQQHLALVSEMLKKIITKSGEISMTDALDGLEGQILEDRRKISRSALREVLTKLLYYGTLELSEDRKLFLSQKSKRDEN